MDDLYHEVEGKKNGKAKMFYLVFLRGLAKDLEQVMEEEFIPFARTHYGEPVVGGGPMRLLGGVSAEYDETATVKIEDEECSGSEGYGTAQDG